MIRQWPLVGRSEELAVIADATRAGAERARGIVLSGSAGVGKTRVAREAVAGCGARNARRHWIVGTASARGVPLGAFVDVASDFGPDPLRRVREVIDGLIGDARYGEVVVGVDDAHLLDDLSAFTVHQLVTRRLATVILTIRTGEPPPDAITAIWKDQHLERLELQPLSPAEIADLLERVLDGPVDSFSAQRLWQFTQGNALYLRHLLDNEVDAGRMTRRAGVWLWDGRPRLSPTLAELLEARMSDVPTAVREVLDALAIAEPLESDVLESIADADALAEAESLGLVTVDAHVRPASVRLAHPLLGEVRRTGSLRLQRLRGRIATELGRKSSTDPRDLIRRAALLIESDLTPDSDLLLAAAAAAMQLLDHRLAETLAARAVAVGGGPWAKIAHAMAITWQERGVEAEAVLGEQAAQATGLERTQVAILRAMNFLLILGRVADAERELDVLPADDESAQAIATALRPLIELVRGHSRAAVDMAITAEASAEASDVAKIFLAWVFVTGRGDLGQIDEIASAANAGYAVADRSPEVGHLRRRLAFQETHGYRLAGTLAQSDAVVDRIRRDTLDVPFEESWHRVMVGLSAMSRGALDDARCALRDALAYLGTGDSGRMVKTFGRTWLTTVTGMAGLATDARREFDAIEWWAQDPAACMFDPYLRLAETWACAAEGAVSQAISIMRDAAVKEFELGRPAWEVVLLQTATQFGDHTTTTRLADLATQVQGPRAPTAAAHAMALAAGDGDALLDVSHRYETFGDRLAAADAAAQAVVAYQHAGLRGAAMTASATAQRLTSECQGAQTPALRAGTTAQPFTARQREIISLAAQGLSNKQIADRLTMSIRSVEGHLFRASQRVAANSREQLISILRGS
ncbi:LuxR C-terminal-related transcriptional regulator [Mycolicibacterium sp. HK-90]|uniref:LuxR C-terminal-related transcriptional regulator n=1 Tax=Mycolicibacterium sp. HK-90 TaxID=3056937 RepID=UPI00265B6AE7|nr:LuxR family transcriptional regulator [Mycolicibacterium sp. HK-90]WKG02624.1 LuxR C-terminal-related transcriptional regulator [Mycolicibacterium sp. HK-90]